MRTPRTLFLGLMLGLLCAVPVAAQEASHAGDTRTLSSHAMDAAVADHDSEMDRQRTQLAELLSRPELRNVAGDRGIDMGRVESLAAGLSDGEMRGLAPLVTEATAALDNGLGSISVVGIIIILALLVAVLVII